jgi:hypothetical protein
MNINESSPEQRLPITRLRKRPTGRNERRRAERETRTILKMLMPIEMKFNREILSVELSGEYEEIYKKYLHQWQLAIFAIEHMDIRMTEANSTYFAEMYSPRISSWTTDKQGDFKMTDL